ncbi:MAG: hypothetical protein QG657_417 [Acidobacteriota bacterium]|nr:hypothetical protein [Acidobacteriota bacterium]
MNFYKLPLDRKMGVSEIALANTRKNQVIMERIATYKYDENRLGQGDRIIVRIKQLTLRWNKAQSERMLATNELYAARKEIKAVYGKTRRIARILFQDQEPQRRVLAMDGPRKQLLPQWLEQARQFYTNALADPEILRQFSGYGVTAKRLNEEKTLLAKLEKAMANQEKKAGQAMEITRERKSVIKELDHWMSKFFTILRLAMGKSQMLEAVGIVVK